MLQATNAGLYCPDGDFHVDPWKPVDRAVITHAHGDHVAWGSKAYLTSAIGQPLLSGYFNPVMSNGLAYALAFLILTYLSVALGELVPKAMALQRAEPPASRGTSSSAPRRSGSCSHCRSGCSSG